MFKKGEIIRLMTDYIGVHNGYLGDFNITTLTQFYPVYCDLDLSLAPYAHQTKKEIFQHILEQEKLENQIKIVRGVFKKYPVESFPKEEHHIKQKIFEEYQDILKKYEEESINQLSQIEIDAHFTNINKQIIEEINHAKHLIWVAVSWFTDKSIFTRLAHRKYEGLTVELILVDDSINKQSGLDYDKYITTYWAAPDDKLMHNKFCIIDLNTCITGSYNWTNKAAFKNLENITITKNTETISQYASEFVRIKGLIIKKT